MGEWKNGCHYWKPDCITSSKVLYGISDIGYARNHIADMRFKYFPGEMKNKVTKYLICIALSSKRLPIRPSSMSRNENKIFIQLIELMQDFWEG